ncbi:MAG: hypothetical protein K0S37_679 [Microbacterium sp.]|nr:hypothetical protein [Microbacterium sp.]
MTRPEHDAAEPPTGAPTTDLFEVADVLASDPTDARPTIRARMATWGSLFRRNRPLWVTTIIAVTALVAGLVVGRFVVSPADAAANTTAPAPGLVTVPVAFGPLSNDVTIRAEVGYADPVEVQIDTAGLPGPPVVTGQVPAVGAQLDALSIALEVAGRPVIVLPGELPSYRTLRYGVSGPDVVQFKWAMRTVGLDAGDPGNNVFDEQAANAVTALYAQVGYPAPPVDDEAAAGLRSAQAAVAAAEQSVATANAAYDKARAGASDVDKREADNAVASAQRALDQARQQNPIDSAKIGDLQDALDLAQLKRRQLDAAPDASTARAELDAARSHLDEARAELTSARQRALPALPAGEVLFLTSLPRRVDSVDARRGTELKGTAMVVSGATVALSGSASEVDARLLKVGDKAQVDLPDGSTHGATISALAPGTQASDRWSVTLAPDPLTPEQVTELQGKNVRVGIPVGATAGDVLNVPLAALSAGPGGEDRVEVVDGDPRDGDKAVTRLVRVETGLAAQGAVEVKPLDGELNEGDLVVVGR